MSQAPRLSVYAVIPYELANDRMLASPRMFCGNRELKRTMLETLCMVAAEMVNFCVATNQLTSSVQGGVVREPEYLRWEKPGQQRTDHSYSVGAV